MATRFTPTHVQYFVFPFPSIQVPPVDTLSHPFTCLSGLLSRVERVKRGIEKVRGEREGVRAWC